ncbi:SdrD B-like domain-containing protein, partial [Tessaracoccus sp. OH4464_COT-324]|uniref:SdrD B-like domain-containing protein n=1 Tax=Tessaracoccus sp. OH4464_COT-324 TaxID=2491059 RepID=UPI000FB5AE52
DGGYLFEDLPVLGAGESYKVCVTDPAGLVPTLEGTTTRDKDSSTNCATSMGLTKDGEADLTLDFGFVTPKVSVGDYVWEDVDNNGIQNDGEPGIPGVQLTIVGPDGKLVKDVDGNPVPQVKTDTKGKYLFDALPALKDGESYKVCVAQPAGMLPTKANATSRDKDSSTTCEVTQGLMESGDSDLTLDFGFYKKPMPKKPGMPKTGV